VDESPSQNVGDRQKVTAEAIAHIERSVQRMRNLEMRVIRAGGAGDGTGGPVDGTRLFQALARGTADVPRARIAATFIVTDGQVHDVPAARNAEPFGGPVHTILTGNRNEFDRRLVIRDVPKFGIVGKQVKLTIRIEDSRAQGGSVPVTLVPRRRGLIRLNDLRVMLPDPLGIFQRCVKVPAPPAMLAVLPRRYPLPRFELPGSARFQPGGEATARHSGSTGEFTGLRDYEPGDPLRLIHWPTWARTGKPVVKELEDTFFPRHGLILDTFPAAGDEDLFEADEAFLTSTTREAVPIVTVGERTIGTGRPGPITQKLLAGFRRRARAGGTVSSL